MSENEETKITEGELEKEDHAFIVSDEVWIVETSDSDDDSSDDDISDDNDGKKKNKKKTKKNKKKDKSKNKEKSESTDDEEEEIFDPQKDMQTAWQICLDAHNEKRKLHKDTPPLTLDKKLCEQAQEGADDLAKRNAFAHDTEKYGAGENLFRSSAGKNQKELTKERALRFAAGCVESWYQEIDYYSFKKHGKKDPKNPKTIGHFTQVVYKATEKMGFGIAKRKDGKTIVVCRYFPRGNMNTKKNFPEQIGELK